MNGIDRHTSIFQTCGSRFFRIFMNLHYHSLSKNLMDRHGTWDFGGILGALSESFRASGCAAHCATNHGRSSAAPWLWDRPCLWNPPALLDEDFMLWNPGWEAWKVEKWIRNGDRTVLRPFLFEENTSQTPNSARYTETCPLRMSWFPQLKDWGRVGSSTKEVFCLPEIHWFGGEVEVEQVDFFPWTYHQRSRSLDFIQEFRTAKFT